MSEKKSIQNAFQLSDTVLQSYLSDLSDDELLTRPSAGCNHLAWQIGHLISSEGMLLNMVKEGSSIPLPDGFAEAHDKSTTESDDASQFLSKDEYLKLYQQTRSNSIDVISGMTDEQLDAESPENFRSFCPDIRAMTMLIATHPMMHVGQFVPVRRALGKPILM
ncbi:MAG: DinB family protein [Planctomycetota bacterium]